MNKTQVWALNRQGSQIDQAREGVEIESSNYTDQLRKSTYWPTMWHPGMDS